MLDSSNNSKHFGTAKNTAPKQTAIAAGLPGKLIIKLLPRVPAVWRDKIAVGTVRKLTVRICSAKPSNIRSQTA